jgi:hypothetical protein
VHGQPLILFAKPATWQPFSHSVQLAELLFSPCVHLCNSLSCLVALPLESIISVAHHMAFVERPMCFGPTPIELIFASEGSSPFVVSCTTAPNCQLN